MQSKTHMSNKIKTIRKTMNLNTTDFGELVGVSKSAVEKYEAGIRNPRPSVVILIESLEYSIKDAGLTIQRPKVSKII